jgi:catechol 2,3-dioxygenase-like lactoylglutathione lyase family enzyme
VLPKKASLKHIALAVRHLDACEAFYHVLGMHTELKTEDYVYLTHHEDSLSLHRVTHQFSAHQRLEHIGFPLDSADAVNKLYQDALKNHLNILSEPKTFGIGTHSFSIQDPDGIEVEFVYHPTVFFTR